MEIEWHVGKDTAAILQLLSVLVNAVCTQIGLNKTIFKCTTKRSNRGIQVSQNWQMNLQHSPQAWFWTKLVPQHFFF